MEIIGAGEGVTYKRAVGVNEPPAGGSPLDLNVGGGKACAGSGRLLSVLAGQHHAGQRELSPYSGAGARAGR